MFNGMRTKMHRIVSSIFIARQAATDKKEEGTLTSQSGYLVFLQLKMI